ncbi:MAG: DUF6531 domain-containing protein [Bacillota bacterium]|nr:DUF6531 domain-containing protein [Bacillota bacterium]
MYKDFSKTSEDKLKEYVDEVSSTGFWDSVVDKVSDCLNTVGFFLGLFNSQKTVEGMGDYQKKIIDTKNTTKKEISTIFSNVRKVDTNYGSGLSQNNSLLINVNNYIKDLADCIDPNGGNLDSAYMTKVLVPSKKRIKESQTTVQDEIENKMLGTDPDAASLSVDPVNLSTGNYVYDHQDLLIMGSPEVIFHRYYNAKDSRISSLGKGFKHNYDIELREIGNNYSIVLEDGRCIHFELKDDVYVGKDTAEEHLFKVNDEFILKTRDGNIYKFNSFNKISRLEDENKIGISFEYDENENLIRAKADNESELLYTYVNDLLVDVKDHTGRKIQFIYKDNFLEKAIMPNGREIKYSYDSNGRIIDLPIDGNEKLVVNVYDDKDRVIEQQFIDGSSMSFEYDDENKTVTQIERNGVKTVYVHDDKKRNTEIIYEDGTTEKFVYNEKNQCIKKTDRLGHSERYAYDNKGNVVQKIDPLRRRFNMTYDNHNNLLTLSLNGKSMIKNRYDSKGNLIYTENAAGIAEMYKVDDYGRVISTIHSDNSETNIIYDERGNVSKVENPDGGVIKYEYNDLNQVIKLTDPNGNSTYFDYDVNGNVIKTINALGYETNYTYNINGLLESTSYANGTVEKRTYNKINQLEEVIDEQGYSTKYIYDSMWNVSKILLPNGSVEEYLYDKDNHLSTIKIPGGTTIHTVYDANGNIIEECTNDDKKIFKYDALGNTISVKQGDEYSTVSYDMFGNVAEVKRVNGEFVKKEYDEFGRLEREYDNLGALRIYRYDSTGTLSEEEDELGNITKYNYYPGKRIKSIIYPNGEIDSFIYDLNGNVVEHKDKKGNVIELRYDSLNRNTETYLNGILQESLEYNEVNEIVKRVDALNNATYFTYSSRGEVLSVTDPNGTKMKYDYNSMGDVLKEVITGPTGEVKFDNTYEYNEFGQLVCIKDIQGYSTKYQYNNRGELIETIDKEGYHVSYGYNQRGNIDNLRYQDGREVSFKYNEKNVLKEIIDWNGKTSFVTDTEGRVTSVTYPDGKNVGYVYNSFGEISSMKYPNGKEIYYNYDKLKRISSITNGDSQIIYKYNEDNEVVKRIYPNGTSTEYEYNRCGFPTVIKNIDKEGILDQYEIGYDALGRKNKLNRWRRNDAEYSGLFEYSYGNTGFLEEVKKNGSVLRKYEYDSFGNRTRKFDKNGEEIYHYNNLNQLVSKSLGTNQETYEYDKRGNLIEVKSNGQMKYQYCYDTTNRLSKSFNSNGEKSTYAYNGLGYRIGQTKYQKSGTKQINYVVNMLRLHDNLLEKDENGEVQTYIWSGFNPVAINHKQSDYYCYHDEMGSISDVISFDGNLKEKFGFDEFGNELYEVDNSINPFGYTGYLRNYDMGTSFAQAREYISDIGRFAGRDIVKGMAPYNISYNEYLYCRNDPNSYEDRNGQIIILTAVIAGAAIGGIASAGLNYVGQKIKVAQGKQDEIKKGEIVGSFVSGAIIGGVSGLTAGVPTGIAAVGNIIASGAGGAAESFIKQKIDNGKVDLDEVGKDATVGAVTGALGEGLKFGGKWIGGKISNKVSSSELLSKQYEKIKKIIPGKGDVNKFDAKNSLKEIENTGTLIENQKTYIATTELKPWETGHHRDKVLKKLIAKEENLRMAFKHDYVVNLLEQKKKEAFKKILKTLVAYKTPKEVINDFIENAIKEGPEEALNKLSSALNRPKWKLQGKCPIYA